MKVFMKLFAFFKANKKVGTPKAVSDVQTHITDSCPMLCLTKNHSRCIFNS